MTTAQLADIHLNDFNARKFIDDDAFKDLCDSVAKHGVITPVLVRDGNGSGGFELIAGERRYRAAVEAGLMEIPIHVKEVDDPDAHELMFVENLHRQDLTPMEEARGFKEYLDRHGADAAITLADRLSKPL